MIFTALYMDDFGPLADRRRTSFIGRSLLSFNSNVIQAMGGLVTAGS